MSTIRRSALVSAAAAVLLLSTAGAAGAASGDGSPTDPLDGVVKQLTNTVHQATQQVQQAGQQAQQTQQSQQASVPSQDAPTPPASDDDSSGNETTDPKAPDHASSHALHGELLPGQATPTPLTAEAGSGTSTINDDGSSSADASVLALGGMTLYGSQASSSGSNDGHGATDPVCSGTDNAVCPLQADSHATQTSTASDSSTKTAAASICLTPPSQMPITLPDPITLPTLPTSSSTDCPNGLGIDALQSSSTMHRDTTTGDTSGSTQSSAAGVCVPGVPTSDTCIGLLTSHGSADSDGTTDRGSSVADIFGNSTPLTQPQGTPDQLCHPTADTTGLCAYINQGETYLASGVAGVAQNAATGNLLGLISFDAAHSEVLVHNAGGTAVVSPPTTVPPAANPPVVSAPATTTTTHHASVVDDVAAALPHTGGIWSGWLAIGLLCFSAGCALAAKDLRRVRVTG
ncbi:hypothetical protein D9V37_10545 [Nocardioides mangrovicus]|uniref:LPXTG cell wall anchor domain-containing protein n=1 Tax=Nocardioides mangrovicus TaxID=2478913 RepID=A0A3L8P2E4_9ACTN|nr:hypothetical protein [Nocardioides mangrovicus]RLV49013.1 hypothetical protein D9V37_10545 [Nocardioides mangrovicus]